MKVYSFSNFGYEGSIVEVEVDLRRGIPAVDIVGLADCAVKETRDRMRAAIMNSGLEFPSERVLISLSPADMRKDTPMDLAIAISILSRAEELDYEPVMILGELELSGKTRPVRGVHAAVSTAISCGITRFIVPQYNENELKAFENISYISADNLKNAFEKLKKGEFENMIKDTSVECDVVGGIEFPKYDEAYGLIDGYEKPIRAMVIAAAGGHNVLFTGGPGCGKTMLLQRMPALLPLNTVEESQSVTRIWSLAGLVSPSDNLIRRKPFRMPHQTASIEGICGGGPNCRPGEISLAHNGVLFLDEAAEFRSSVLQMLRVPLESHSITLSRAGRTTVYPANFQLLMATNPCPCGNYGSDDKICLCSVRSIEQYWHKFSAPLLDRVDIRLKVEKDSSQGHLTIEQARGFIAKATIAQRKRGVYNSKLTPEQIFQYCKLDCETTVILDTACEKGLSARGRTSVLKLARTIADIDGSEEIKKVHLEEALSMREPIPLENY